MKVKDKKKKKKNKGLKDFMDGADELAQFTKAMADE
jgi:hypothetical protein